MAVKGNKIHSRRMKIFLVRHGEGENSGTHWQTPDTHLNEMGKKQAAALAGLPRFNNVDKIVCSRWARSQETAKIVAKILNKQIEIFDDINERKQSRKIYGQDRNNQLAKQYLIDIRQNGNNSDWKWDEEEESVTEVANRAEKFKKHLIDNYANKTLLMFSHDEFIRYFIAVCLFGNKPDEKYFRTFIRSIFIQNTSVSLMVHREEHKVWKLWYLNDYSHLKM